MVAQNVSLLAVLQDVSGVVNTIHLEPLSLLLGILNELKVSSDPKLQVSLLFSPLASTSTHSFLDLQASKADFEHYIAATKSLSGRFWSKSKWEELLEPVTREDAEELGDLDGEQDSHSHTVQHSILITWMSCFLSLVFDGQSHFIKHARTNVASIQALLLRSYISSTTVSGEYRMLPSKSQFGSDPSRFSYDRCL